MPRASLGKPEGYEHSRGLPHVSDTTSLPSRKSWLNLGGNIEIFVVLFFGWDVKGLLWDMSTFVVSSPLSDGINSYHPGKVDTKVLNNN